MNTNKVKAPTITQPFNALPAGSLLQRPDDTTLIYLKTDSGELVNLSTGVIHRPSTSDSLRFVDATTHYYLERGRNV